MTSGNIAMNAFIQESEIDRYEKKKLELERK